MDRSRHPAALHVTLRRAVDGAPLAAPAALDALAERWWRLPPRLRLALVAVAVLTVIAAGTLHLTRSPWGAPVTVLVAAQDLEVGRTLAAGDLRSADRPAGLVPAGALREADHAVGATVVSSVPAGGVVTDRSLGDGGLGAGVPAGHAAVALPVELLPPLPPGARLDLVAADLDARGVLLAGDAVVLAEDDLHVWVVVGRPEAADVAAAAAAGTVSVVVVPP
jgi:pilus assembly protein CpaB